MSAVPVMPRPATYEDLLAAPDHLVAELMDGELHLSPRPRNRHARVGWKLATALGALFDHDGDGDGPGGWLFVFEPELHLAPKTRVVSPDLAGWRRERMPEVPDEAYFTAIPDWVCEVLSPGTSRFDRLVKLPRYASHGVPHAWVVDVEGQTIEVLRNTDGRWLNVLTADVRAPFRAEPFDAVELDFCKWWPGVPTIEAPTTKPARRRKR
jgi:Uma2 family endonuclease